MTFQEKFDELKAKYGTIDESKLGESFAIQVDMTEDEGNGTFYVAYMNGVFAIEPYDYHDYTAKITVSVKNLEAILACKKSAVNLFLTGKLSVDGNVDHALKLVELMAKKEEKPARKKAAKSDEEAAEKKPAKKASKKSAK